MELPPGFEFSEASKDDIPELFSLLDRAMGDFEAWKIVFKNTDSSEILPWLLKTNGPRFEMDDITTWKIIEKSSG